MPATVGKLVQAMESIAPRQYAAAWDNVGLLLGRASWDADPILLTIDLTPAVLEEAIRLDAQCIVAYHPPIFDPIRSLNDSTPQQLMLLDAARRGIAVYSPHTALDAAPEGLNDWLAGALGPGDVRALKPFESQPESQQCKIITYAPADAVDKLRQALAAIGAGCIGRYQQCSFEIKGSGTFLGGEGSSPAVGKAGRLERVDEVRLEMVCPRAALGLAVISIKQFHPYEEPPIEIYELQPRPHRGIGEGRRIVLDRKIPLKTIVDAVKAHLGLPQVMVAAAPAHSGGGSGGGAKIGMVGFCAGSGGSLLDSAIDQRCEAFVTGEMKHHDVLAAQARGCSVILAGHTNTERPYLKVLRKRLSAALDGANVIISKMDADPLKAV